MDRCNLQTLKVPIANEDNKLCDNFMLSKCHVTFFWRGGGGGGGEGLSS